MLPSIDTIDSIDSLDTKLLHFWRQIRHCYDPLRHPKTPFHVHPHGDDEIRPEPPISAERALALFEQRLADELYQEATSEIDMEAYAEDIPPDP